jgi:hypothetical protein
MNKDKLKEALRKALTAMMEHKGNMWIDGDEVWDRDSNTCYDLSEMADIVIKEMDQ